MRYCIILKTLTMVIVSVFVLCQATAQNASNEYILYIQHAKGFTNRGGSPSKKQIIDSARIRTISSIAPHQNSGFIKDSLAITPNDWIEICKGINLAYFFKLNRQYGKGGGCTAYEWVEISTNRRTYKVTVYDNSKSLYPITEKLPKLILHEE